MDPVTAVGAWLADPAHWTGPDGIPSRLWEHLWICALAMAAALAIGLALGGWTGHTGRGGALAINTANIGRAVPSYAVMVMILPISLRLNPELGLDVIPILVAMVALAVPPILVNTHVGLRGVDREIVEAARGMGMTGNQVLRRVETPLALPVIVLGVRIAAVQVIATATLGAVLGYGGLGRYLIDGIARQEFDRLGAGVVLVAGLALLAEGLLILGQRRITSPGLVAEGPRG